MSNQSPNPKVKWNLLFFFVDFQNYSKNWRGNVFRRRTSKTLLATDGGRTEKEALPKHNGTCAGSGIWWVPHVVICSSGSKVVRNLVLVVSYVFVVYVDHCCSHINSSPKIQSVDHDTCPRYYLIRTSRENRNHRLFVSAHVLINSIIGARLKYETAHSTLIHYNINNTPPDARIRKKRQWAGISARLLRKQ